MGSYMEHITTNDEAAKDRLMKGTVKLTDFLEVSLINMPAKSLIFRASQN